MSNKTSTGFGIKVSGNEDVFVKVPASKLRLDDEFMKYEPKTMRESFFKEDAIKVIRVGMYDFLRPVCDPSFDNNRRICYQPGNKPAVGKSYDWWEEEAKKYAPERGSRLGTKSEYIAFMAVLIKELVDSGKPVEWAWDAVCNDSKELGHYWNSRADHYHYELSATGDREICGWCDLANTYKILAKDEEAGVFWHAGGYYYVNGNERPLAGLSPDIFFGEEKIGSCGWLVLEK